MSQTHELHGADSEELLKYKLIKGHIHGDTALYKLGKNYHYITLIREPIERAISDYFFHRNLPDSVLSDPSQPKYRIEYITITKNNKIEDFVRMDHQLVSNAIENNSLKWLIGHKKFMKTGSYASLFAFQELLINYSCVGIQEDLDNFIFQLNRAFGFNVNISIKRLNVGKKNETYDYEAVKKILELRNAEEIKLYEAIKMHLDRFGIWKVVNR